MFTEVIVFIVGDMEMDMGNKKLDFIIKAIEEAKVITPKGDEVKVYLDNDEKLRGINPVELNDILIKLQNDERIVRIKSFPDWLLPSTKFTHETINQIMSSALNPSLNHFAIETLEGFEEWCANYWSKSGSIAESSSSTRTESNEVLIDKQFTDPFFNSLVLETNLAYGFGLKRATLVLYRALLENLLIELLRAQFKMERLDLFFDEQRGKFHDLSVLIANLRDNLTVFKPYSAGFEEAFCQKLDKYKERANASAHKLEMDIDPNFFTATKKDMNFICDLLVGTIQKLGRNL